jgi:Mn-dependent DtxR family transcriptional regulator
MSENTEAVLKTMQDTGKPMRPGQVAKILGIESKEVSKAIKILRKEGKVHSPKRCYYAPVE